MASFKETCLLRQERVSPVREGQCTLHKQLWSLRIITKGQGGKKSELEGEHEGAKNPGQSRFSDLNSEMSEKIFKLTRESYWSCIHAKRGINVLYKVNFVDHVLISKTSLTGT